MSTSTKSIDPFLAARAELGNASKAKALREDRGRLDRAWRRFRALKIERVIRECQPIDESERKRLAALILDVGDLL